MSKDDKVTLAIESAIDGGSVSLIYGPQVAERFGSSSVSRANELLRVIDEVLAEARVDRREIDIVAVSTGPGSYTGIRIGIATALGLKNALNCDVYGVSALKAMAGSFAGMGPYAAVVPYGKNDVAWQFFQNKDGVLESLSEPAADSRAVFSAAIFARKADHIVIHPLISDLAFTLESPFSAAVPSRAIADAALHGSWPNDLTPLYLRSGSLPAAAF